MTEPNTESQGAADAQLKREQWEQSLLERLAFASLAEQRKARRWGIFFKSFFALYLLALLLLAVGASFSEKRLTGKYTALVDLDGVIGADYAASADNIIGGLRGAFDSGAKGVILRANSPGGSPVQARYINSEIRRLRKEHPDTPVYAVISDICASGCYYVVVAADKIYASESSIVGSIGVLIDGFGFVDTLKKLGVERRLLTAGKHKGFLDPFSPLKPADKQHALQMLDKIHEQFIQVVREGRGPALKETPQTFSGLMWTGNDARQMGLIDEFGSASYVAREVIGAEDIIDFTHRENILDRFARRIGVAMAKTFATLASGHGLTLR